jgi:hypothetical protein
MIDEKITRYDKTKKWEDYNLQYKGRVVKYFNSENRYIVYGIFPALEDKEETLDKCIVILQSIYGEKTTLKHILLSDFLSVKMHQNKEVSRFQMEVKVEGEKIVFQPPIVKRIHEYQEEQARENGGLTNIEQALVEEKKGLKLIKLTKPNDTQQE